MEGCDTRPGNRKYIVGGLNYYQLSANQMQRRFIVKQPEVLSALNRVKSQHGQLAWAIELKNFTISYTNIHRGSVQAFPFDPKDNIVGLWVG